MPSIKSVTPLIGGKYYHIFNRGINSQNIFFQTRNYSFFLTLFEKYLSEYTEVLSYCLLPNHFHFLIRLKETIFLKTKTQGISTKVSDEIEIGKLVSEHFRKMLISYSQAINRQESRTGSLFVRNFKRIELEDDEHLRYLFFYIHFNPQKHGLLNNFRLYRYCSFQAYLSNQSTKISKEFGLKLFGGLDNFKRYHQFFHDEKKDIILE